MVDDDDIGDEVSRILVEMETILDGIQRGDRSPLVDGKVALTKDTKLDRYELTTIRAMIFWISRQTGIHAETVRSMLLAEFNVQSVETLTIADYDGAVQFLADYAPKIN